MFTSLSEKIQSAVQKFSTSKRLNEDDIKEPLKEIRRALLEADVNFKVAKNFVDKVKARVLEETDDNYTSARSRVLHVVSECLQEILGGTSETLKINPKPPTVIMLVGLQGAGKTTTAGKIAHFLKKRKNKKVLLVAADIYRPAAAKQLEVLAEKSGAAFFSLEHDSSAEFIAEKSVEKAKYLGCDTVIIDTAGRLHIDARLMDELKNIRDITTPDEIMLVLDGMTGQEAVNVASSFDEQLGITGLVFTKLDGDTRGGAILSVKSVTGKPIKLIGTGEHLDAIEEFHPDRIASRILGMGDLATLAETVKDNLNDVSFRGNKIVKEKFDLEDFLDYIQKIKKMGSMKSLLKMLPGIKSDMIDSINEDELKQVQSIIQSMTLRERRSPELIKYSRKKRIANGCGRTVQEVNSLLKRFEELKKTMKLLKGKSKYMPTKGLSLPF